MIDPGVIHSNRVYHLRAADGRELLLKVYYRDDRRRLQREFGAFRFLRRRGLTSVPEAHLADDAEQWGVYSWEPGRTKAPSELTMEEMAAFGRLAADLQRCLPGEPGADFPRGFGFGPIGERARLHRERLATCLAAAAAPDAYPELRAAVAETGLPDAFERLLQAALTGLTAGELAAPVPAEHVRLNPGDFAPHNVMVRPDGSLCAIDFEYVGWDDALVLPASFLAAEQSLGLTGAQRDAFLTAYHAARDVPDAAFARLDREVALLELSWALVNLSLMTPVHVARKQFAGGFDLPAHLADRRRKLEARLAGAGELVRAFAC